MTLQSQRIVIVGGSSGIGLAVAQAALTDGARVVIASSQAAKVEAAVATLGANASGFTVDVTHEAGVAARLANLGAFDHLVYTAGDWSGAGRGPLAELDLDAARAAFAVRYWGAVNVVKHAHANMPASGSITLTDGTIAHRPAKGSALMTGMAGAVEHLARGLAVDLAPIRVNAVCPGVMRTGVWDSVPADRREARFAVMTCRLPLPRPGEPSEAAEAYLYLMRGGYTTGQVLLVDGGGSLV